MRFTNGYWMTRPEFDMSYATQVYQVKNDDRTLEVLAATRAFRPIEMTVEIGDDIRLKGKYMICSIANGRYIGGGIPIMPRARVDDGLLDVLVVDPLPPWRIPFYLPAILGGTLVNTKIAHHYRTPHCAISSPQMRMNMDGEILPMESARFVCKPASLLAHWPGSQEAVD